MKQSAFILEFFKNPHGTVEKKKKCDEWFKKATWQMQSKEHNIVRKSIKSKDLLLEYIRFTLLFCKAAIYYAQIK